MALTLAEQRKLPGFEEPGNAGISSPTPYGSRRYANKVSAIGREPSGFAAFTDLSPDGLRHSANKGSTIWLTPTGG